MPALVPVPKAPAWPRWPWSPARPLHNPRPVLRPRSQNRRRPRATGSAGRSTTRVRVCRPTTLQATPATFPSQTAASPRQLPTASAANAGLQRAHRATSFRRSSPTLRLCRAVRHVESGLPRCAINAAGRSQATRYRSRPHRRLRLESLRLARDPPGSARVRSCLRDGSTEAQFRIARSCLRGSS